jgi:hypothetical protein
MVMAMAMTMAMAMRMKMDEAMWSRWPLRWPQSRGEALPGLMAARISFRSGACASSERGVQRNHEPLLSLAAASARQGQGDKETSKDP